MGISSLFLAQKFNETKPISLRQILKLCDITDPPQIISSFELILLEVLDFNINLITPNLVLELHIYKNEADSISTSLARYILEISLLEYHMIFYRPSQVAFSALYIAQQLF